MKKQITSSDIARLAGVSRSTVSRVVNGYDNVPEQTREKVMAVIKEHHYYPQLSGQLLSGVRTRTLGLFWFGSEGFAEDSLITDYLMSIIDASAARGYLVLSCMLKDIEADGTRNFIRKTFLERRIDAGIFIGVDNNEPVIRQLVELDQIVGLFDYYHENESCPNRLTVNFDGSTAERSIDYLASLGHTKIAVVDGNLSRNSCFARHEGYLKGLRKHDLPIRSQWFTFGDIRQEPARAATLSMLRACSEDLPTAICANNDSAAFGVYDACAELGLKIPEDISVIGADGHRKGESLSPPLTTFAFDFRSVFASLVDRVIDKVEGRREVQQDVFFPGTFLERSSCRRL